MKSENTSDTNQAKALVKTDVSVSSFTDIVYGVAIFIMLVIMVFGAVVWALGY